MNKNELTQDYEVVRVPPHTPTHQPLGSKKKKNLAIWDYFERREGFDFYYYFVWGSDLAMLGHYFPLKESNSSGNQARANSNTKA